MAGRGQVSWLPGIGRPHLPGSSVSPPVADALCVCGFLHPGHSGGTAPASHRTSLDHRPYVRGESTLAPGLRLLLGVLG
jgi:hypothetical protein